MCFIIVSVTGL